MARSSHSAPARQWPSTVQPGWQLQILQISDQKATQSPCPFIAGVPECGPTVVVTQGQSCEMAAAHRVSQGVRGVTVNNDS